MLANRSFRHGIKLAYSKKPVSIWYTGKASDIKNLLTFSSYRAFTTTTKRYSAPDGSNLLKDLSAVNGTAPGDQDWMKLVSCAMMGDELGVQSVVSAGVSVNNACDSEAWSPLTHAAIGGHLGCVDILLRAGAKVDSTDAEGWTALMHAAMGGHAECLSVLIAAGADVDKLSLLGGTALMNAATEGHVACLEVLVAAGANAFQEDNEGNTALDYASDEGHTGAISFLERVLRQAVLSSATSGSSRRDAVKNRSNK